MRKRAARGRAGKVRYAVIGLGYIAQIAALPAFAHARRNSVLAWAADRSAFEALRESIGSGRVVATAVQQRRRRPTLQQEQRRPPVRKPALVNVASPHP